MKTSTLTIIIGLFILLCLSCEKPPPREDCPGGNCPDRPCEDCPPPRSITGEGDIISQTYTVDPFHSVGNIGIATVYITKGNNYEITLSAQPNIIDYILYEVHGEEIILSMDENVSIESSKGIFIDIVTPEIRQVASTGTSFIRLSGPRQGRLRLYNTGTGSINAFNLEVDTCYVSLTGTGSCKVTVNELLDATITGLGNIYYRGHPEIYSHITGLGNLIDSN